MDGPKGYAMIQFSYMILRLYGQGNFTMETELARRKFETQANEKLIAVKQFYPKCPEHIGNVIQVKNLCFFAALRLSDREF